MLYVIYTSVKKAKATEYALETLEKRPDCYLGYQYVQRDPVSRVRTCVCGARARAGKDTGEAHTEVGPIVPSSWHEVMVTFFSFLQWPQIIFVLEK